MHAALAAPPDDRELPDRQERSSAVEEAVEGERAPPVVAPPVIAPPVIAPPVIAPPVMDAPPEASVIAPPIAAEPPKFEFKAPGAALLQEPSPVIAPPIKTELGVASGRWCSNFWVPPRVGAGPEK